MQKIKNVFNNKIIKAGTWYTVTNLLIKGVNFLTIPIFTALMTTSEYGATNLYLSWVNIFAIIISFELYTTIGRAKSDFKDEYNEFHSSAMYLGALIFFVVLFIGVLFENYLVALTGLPVLLFYLMIIHSYGHFLQQYLISKYRFDYNYKKVSIVNVFLTGLGVLFSIILMTTIYSNQKVEGKVIGQLTPIIFVGLFTIVIFLIKGNFKFKFSHWKYALLLGGPLILHSLSYIVNNQFDRILIDKYLGKSEVGVYSFVYNIGMILQIILTSAIQAWVPWFYEKLEQDKRLLIKEAGKGFRDLFLLVFTGILFLTPELMQIMAGDDAYLTDSTISLVTWILIAGFFQFMYNIETYIEIFHNRTSLVSIASIISAILNLILNIIFIPIYGTIAAAITTAFSYFVMFVMHYIMSAKVIKDEIFGLKFHLVSLVNLTMFVFIFYFTQEYLLIRLVFLLGLSLYFLKKIYNIYNDTFKKIND